MKVKKAKKVIRRAFKKDPDFKRTYVDNVAMHLSDTFSDNDSISGYHIHNLRDKKIRDKIAEGIIDLIFRK